MKYPQAIQSGEAIGITATSSGQSGIVDIQLLENAILHMKEKGYSVVETKNARNEDQKFVSSSAEERTKQWEELYSNPAVKHIITTSGGEFLMEILPWLEQIPLAEKTPKWVQGFSDTSLLLYYLTTKYEIATLHGPNFGGYGRKEVLPSYLQPFKMTRETESIQESFPMYEPRPINWEEGKEFELPVLNQKVVYQNLYGEKPEKIQGRLLGGCLDVLKTLMGTPYDYTQQFCEQYPEGILWYLENCEMNVCDLYRTLWQMREAGWFHTAKGFLFGRTMSQEAKHEFTYEDALHSALDSLHVPVIYDIDVGHTQLQWTMMNGSFATFEYEVGKGRIKQEKK